MNLGTIMLHNKIYNLDNMEKNELENLLEDNIVQKTNEYDIAKKICKREVIQKKYSSEDIPNLFKSFLDSSSLFLKSEAMIQRAFIQKTSYDAVISKVKSKENSIISSIKKISPKFDKTNKKYSNIQNDIEKSLKKYESVLYSIADFYDNKIEQLILKKVEVNANIVGSIIRNEYLIEEESKKQEAKEQDKLLLSLSNSVKSYVKKFMLKKEEKKVLDVTMIADWKDKAELEEEQKNKLNLSYENTKNLKKDNIQMISSYEDQVISLEKEIKRLNENKVKEIIGAMESESKWITISKNNTNILGRIKLFFKSRINPTKVIYNSILNPMNNSIKDYEENVLKNIKD